MNPDSTLSSAANRRYDIDALRVLAFGLLIFYHVGMFYVMDWDWHVKSVYLSEWLQVPMLWSNQWRMLFLFLVSGLAVNFLLGKTSTPRFAWLRTKRLMVPLLFGMAVIVPPQAYLQAVANGMFNGNYLEFLIRYFTFQPWPAGAFDGADPGITWNHLWYLPYLWFFTMIFALGQKLFAHPKLREHFHALRGWKLMLLPLIPLMLNGWLVFPHFPESTHDLLGDWYMNIMYFTFFLYGFLIGKDGSLWREIARLRMRHTLLACTTFAAYLLIDAHYPEDAPRAAELGFMAVIYLNRWLWVLTALGWGHVLLNRPSKFFAYANDAVFSWYILHQTVIVVAGYYLSKLELGPVTESVALLVVTAGGCFLLHEFLIRRTAFLRPLFGCKPATRETRPEHELSRRKPPLASSS